MDKAEAQFLSFEVNKLMQPWKPYTKAVLFTRAAVTNRHSKVADRIANGDHLEYGEDAEEHMQEMWRLIQLFPDEDSCTNV